MKSVLNNRFHLILVVVLVFFALLGLWIRLLPMEFLLSGSQPLVSMTDSWYTVRQVEQIIPHFLTYPWYDAMLSFPTGKTIDWGPVFPLFVSLIAIIGGASEQSEIIRIISWVPPILGLLLIPLLYFFGKIIWNKEAGYLSALLISVLGGETLFRSFYGYVDHHIMEVLLSTLFFVFYFLILSSLQKNSSAPGESLNKDGSIIAISRFNLSRSFTYAILAGMSYYFAIMTIPTCNIIAGIVALCTLLLPLVIRDNQSILHILKINCTIFGLFLVLFAFTGIHVPGYSFGQYSMAHLLIPLGIIIESLILYVLSLHHISKNRLYYYFILSFMMIGLLISFNYVFPEIISSFIGTLKSTLGLGASGITIDEMQPSDPFVVIQLFNIASILAIFGLISLLIAFCRKKEPLHIGILVWTITYLGLSFLVTRYFYYGGEVMVLLSAIGLSEIYIRIQRSNPIQKVTRVNKVSVPKGRGKETFAIIVIGLLVGIITVLAIPVSNEVAHKETEISSINNEWIVSLDWFKNESEAKKIDYYSIYRKNEFSYPENSSTVLSWWVYGHWILALSHEVIVTSPFEDNMGKLAKYFLSESNKNAERIANYYSGKYIITTNELLFNDFPTISKWISRDSSVDPYYFLFFNSANKKSQMLTPMLGMKSSFFNTTLVKLHVNDGSYIQANGSTLVFYSTSVLSNKEVYVIKQILPLNQSQTTTLLPQKPPNQEIISLKYKSPVIDTPALENYRLIYESNGTRTFPGNVTLNNIKIFERVKGYTIPGSGTIELPLVTNQGRKFTYRQQSIKNTFTLPYATRNSPYDVHATGPYRIIETNKTVEVDESQIKKYYI